ncbi:MAG: hypothetical protein Kow00121_43270 [Elainellaceae cyanobacterium]
MINISGYQILEKLYESSKSLVLRGLRTVDQVPVILKILKHDYPTPETIARFKLEYEITQSLKLPNTIQAYGLEPYQHRYVMILEDFGGVALNKLAASQDFSLEQIISLSIQIVDALHGIHQQHIIHKDINPSNLVYNPLTQQLKVIDFGISSLLSRQNLSLKSPYMMEGTLAYMSPEQTGRMNRAVDYRTDFYSLGATLYQLLAHQRPFATTDIIELVHCHLAKQPPALHDLQPHVPLAISNLVMRLMAKTAEERYQSAIGIKADLEEALRQLRATGTISALSLGNQDVIPGLQIPQKLYGRDREIATLLAAFQQMIAEDAVTADGQPVTIKQTGVSRLMLVAGYSGIGKSVLVRELHKPITQQRGYFVAGKFDQYQRNIPYSAVVSAFTDLVQQLLTEPDQQLNHWRERLLAALNDNGQVIVEFIPDLELVIGKQPAVADLSPLEAQNRFNLVLQRFIHVFAQPEHPLVLFLDDLQWVDTASLKLVELLLAGETQYLFLIGAYRDNEVNATHPLTVAVTDLQRQGAIVDRITLYALALEHIEQFLADALRCDREQVQALAQLVLEKTGGNPFYMNEFLQLLETEKLIQFDEQQRCWQWRLAQIQAQKITSNVVELLAHKAQRLPEQTQHLLQLAASIGNRFDLKTLMIVSEQVANTVMARLYEATIAGLIAPLGDIYPFVEFTDYSDVPDGIEYQFIHDRIQQAVYLLIPEANRAVIHYRIGQLLLRSTNAEQQEQQIFDIVNHLISGAQFISSAAERLTIAQLSLLAGQKAKDSTAYDAAFRYLQFGLSLLDQDSWWHQYDLSLALHQTATEAASLSGELEQMEVLAKIVVDRARTVLDKVKIYEAMMQAYAAQTQLLPAVEVALQALNLLGVALPLQPAPAQIEQAFAETAQKLQGKQIEDLWQLPAATDARAIAAMQLLARVNAPVFQAAPALFPLIILTLVNLSIDYGNSELSPMGYALYGLMLGGIFMDAESSYQFGQLALRLLERSQNKPIQCKTLFVVNVGVRFRKVHLKETIQPLQEAYQIGVNHGDIEFAAYSALHHCDHAFFTALPLPALQQKLEDYIQALTQLKESTNVNALKVYLQTLLNLTHSCAEPGLLIGEAYDEVHELPLLQQANHQKGLFYLYFNKLTLCYWFRLYPEAIAIAALAEPYVEGGRVNAVYPIFRFYESLSCLKLYDQAAPQEQAEILQKVAVNQAYLEQMAEHAPMNYLHKFLLVEAERQRVSQADDRAAELYDRAIHLAEAQGYLQETAVACELAAEFYLKKEKRFVAKAYLQEARYYYLLWGATAKVRQLEQQHPGLLSPQSEPKISVSNSVGSSSSTSETLDLGTVIKASQAIASELVLGRLLFMLLQVAIENAGAEVGYLILETNHQLFIEATRSANYQTAVTVPSIPVADSQLVCGAIVQYVARTQQSLVLRDATQDSRFATNAYILSNQSKSVLCTPLVNQGKLIGVLYLENNLASDAFKPERVQLLNLLSTQMAIAIENARLLQQQETLNQSLRQEREQISQILERITDGFIALDRSWIIIYVNQQAERQLGQSGQDLIGKNLWEVYPDAVGTIFYQQYHQAIQTGRPVKFEEFYAPIRRWLEVNAYPDQGGLSIFFRDITERKQMEERLIHDALHDALTGLPNRLLLTKKLEQAIRCAQQQLTYRFAVLFLDIDRFKVINDSLGHLVGDQLLIAVARRLESCLTDQDTIARLGGDEFIILLENPADEARVAARIQIALNAPFDLSGYKVFNTVSIGIVSSATGYQHPDDLLRAADIAMYRAKAEGKARYVVFDTAMHDQATSLLQLETDLRWAIERRELCVYYQPIVSLKTGRLTGFEALVRWQHPEQGMVAPSKFIPLAEETGLIIPIGQWVLQEACRQLRIWQLRFRQLPSLSMSVNLSVKQFSQSDLIEQIDRVLTNMDLNGQHLKLEITESALISNPETTRALLLQLKERAIRLCIDDFGTGYSSLSYLHQFPIDILKIDRSFVRFMSLKNEDAEIVRTILALASNLFVDVIAEGVETAEQLAELRKLSCEYGQGFLFAQPLDSKAAEALIARMPQW